MHASMHVNQILYMISYVYIHIHMISLAFGSSVSASSDSMKSDRSGPSKCSMMTYRKVGLTSTCENES